MDDDYESWLSQTDPNYESALPQQQQQQTAMPYFAGLGGFGAFSMPMAIRFPPRPDRNSTGAPR